MCRWARKHKIIHPILKEYLEEERKKTVVVEKIEVVGDIAKGEALKKEKEEEKNDEQQQQEQNGAAEITTAVPAADSEQRQLDSSPPLPSSSSLIYKMDGTIPSQPLILQPSSTFAPTTNILDNQIQNKIRKGEYDFKKTDAVLAKLGINNTAKNRDWKGGKGDGKVGGKGRKEEAQEKTSHGGDGDGNGDDKERAKRARLDPEVQQTATTNAPGVKHASDSDFLNSLDTKREPSAMDITAAAPTATAHMAIELPAANFYIETPLHPRERKKSIDFRGKTFLAPLTTVGNLPFRRLCKSLGADITCGEMALATNLLQGQASEWALLKKHPEEDCFGVQLCGGFGDAMARCAQMVEENLQVDFVDVNFGCPIDVVINKSAGSACLLRPNRMKDIIQSMTSVLSCPLTLKMRKGYTDKQDIAHLLLPKVAGWGAAAVTLHGRTREQRYSRLADWEYIKTCADVVKNLGDTEGNNNAKINGGGGGEINGATGVTTAPAPAAAAVNLSSASFKMQLIGNGDVMSWEDHERAITEAGVATTYVARGALLKPWVFTEIKERRHWDISATERLDLIKKFALNGIEHWGSDTRGIENTRRFLLEWLSFANRYVPVGLLEVLPQKTNQRPPAFVGRSDLETLLSSPDPRDWIYLSEMVLGPAPAGFRFTPKHKGTSYASAGGGAGNDRNNDRSKEQEF
jgi:tRNA-dihydrouridine synthase 3